MLLLFSNRLIQTLVPIRLKWSQGRVVFCLAGSSRTCALGRVGPCLLNVTGQGGGSSFFCFESQVFLIESVFG